ncbi:MAG: biopolymer transporter ExbD [Acidobacteriota bacterium]|nr:biopolymer transporter ExbD [Acidobacteriota bacterium]
MAVSGMGQSGVSADINVTPMADIMLVLLIIFMITTPLLQEGVFVNKAKAKNAQEAEGVEAEEATTVTVTRDELIYMNKRPVPDENLIEQLTERAELAGDRPLFIKSDVGTSYGRIVQVINSARDSGFQKIGLLVDREKQQERIF